MTDRKSELKVSLISVFKTLSENMHLMSATVAIIYREFAH